MADQKNRTDGDPNDPNQVVDPTLIGNSKPRSDRTSETERKRERNSRDQERGDVDPDSPEAGVDRDDIGNG